MDSNALGPVAVAWTAVATLGWALAAAARRGADAGQRHVLELNAVRAFLGPHSAEAVEPKRATPGKR